MGEEGVGEDGGLGLRGRTRGGEAEAVGEAGFGVAAAFLQHPLREGARGLEVLHVVHQHECLERRVAALAAHAELLAARRVEGRHARRGRGALDERVEAAPPERLAVVALVGLRVAAGVGHRLPDVVGLVGAHALAAERRHEQAAHGERVVADHLGVEAEARAARVKAVLRVGGNFLRRGLRVLPVGRGGHEQLQELLHVPALLAERDGQPVEQLRVRRRFALRAEVGGGLHEAGAE